MTRPAEQLLAELAARGVEVRHVGEHLKIRPADAVVDLLPELRAQRERLLQLVPPATAPGLAGEILRTLAAGPHSAREIALRLGRPRDRQLYDELGALLDRGEIATAPDTCDFHLPGWRL